MSTGIGRSSRLDWSSVREHVKKHGMRNSNVMAIAPTATIANISGCLPSIEPIYKNLYVKSNFSGEFTIINRYLVEDLRKLGLWSQTIIDKLKYYEGSVQRIYEIPAEVRAKYQEVFELDAHWIVKHAAYRGKWIDQSQSVNIFTSTESGKFISSVYMDAWQSGLKTTYYLRSLAATSIEKSTLDINKNYESPSQSAASDDVVMVEAPVAMAVSAGTSSSEPMVELVSAPIAVQAIEAAAHEGHSHEHTPAAVDKPVSASRVMNIAEDGLCESCQ